MSATHSFLILGGARSGKTRHALEIAQRQPNRVYIATAEAWDDEMRERITRHKEERDETWVTVEEPLYLPAAIERVDAPNQAIVVDCLTLWLSNLMGAERDLEQETAQLVSALTGRQSTIILVSNEVGLGIVPENALARAFRDAQGRLNQRIAAVVDNVDFVAAGLALNLKPGHSS
ncbi:MAG: bifunctional adenosylcobinamide kinase/adenosylcobinamide-phosphate guanylyltransferase [Pseudomonadota bacterium]